MIKVCNFLAWMFLILSERLLEVSQAFATYTKRGKNPSPPCIGEDLS